MQCSIPSLLLMLSLSLFLCVVYNFSTFLSWNSSFSLFFLYKIPISMSCVFRQANQKK